MKLIADDYFSDEPLPNDEMEKVNDKVFFNHTNLNEISDSGDNLNVHPTEMRELQCLWCLTLFPLV